MTELHSAAEVGDLRTLHKFLGKKQNNVNAVDSQGRTALHVAVEKGQVKFIQELIRCKNLNKDILDKNGRSAIQLAPAELQKRLTMIFSQAEAKAITKDKSAKKEDVVEEQMMEENDVESTDVVNPRTLRKVIVCLVLPFVVLIFINGIVFALQYIAITLTFYFVILGYFVSEISIRPPWYHAHPRASRLTRSGCPEYWNGLINDPKTDFDLDYENVAFTSTDNYTLRGWYVPPPRDKNIIKKMGIVLVHGGGRDRRAWLRHVPFLHNAGYGCLLFDFREHGLSDGNMRGFTYGMKERFDVVAACEFMRSSFKFSRICAMGTSVGGSSVIMAGAIDKTINVVIAENALATCATLQDQQIVNIIGGYFSRKQYSMFFFDLFRKTASFWLNWRVGNKPSKHCQSLHCIAKISPRPVLLMHGTNDDVVPYKHSELLYEAAAEPKELYTCEGAFHCGLHNTNINEYERRVLNFLEKYGDATPKEKSKEDAIEKKE